MPLLSCVLPELPCALPDLHSALPEVKKLCRDRVSFACWIVPKFWAFARKSIAVHIVCPVDVQ